MHSGEGSGLRHKINNAPSIPPLEAGWSSALTATDDASGAGQCEELEDLNGAAPLGMGMPLEDLLERLERVGLHDRIPADLITSSAARNRLHRRAHVDDGRSGPLAPAIQASIPACAASGVLEAICSAALTGARYNSKYFVIARSFLVRMRH